MYSKVRINFVLSCSSDSCEKVTLHRSIRSVSRKTRYFQCEEKEKNSSRTRQGQPTNPRSLPSRSFPTKKATKTTRDCPDSRAFIYQHRCLYIKKSLYRTHTLRTFSELTCQVVLEACENIADSSFVSRFSAFRP